MLVAKTFRGSNKSTTCVKLLLIDKGFFLWMQENVKIRTAKQRGALSDVPGTVRNVMCAPSVKIWGGHKSLDSLTLHGVASRPFSPNGFPATGGSSA
jgi:hypothetical protein